MTTTALERAQVHRDDLARHSHYHASKARDGHEMTVVTAIAGPHISRKGGTATAACSGAASYLIGNEG